MAKIAMTFGILLMLVGLFGYLPTGAKTALIPAAFGLAIGIAGAFALKPDWRKHAMHAAAAIGALAFLAALGRVVMVLIKVAGGGERVSAFAVAMLVLMLIISGVFVLLCVRSFIEARRARTLGAPA